MIKITYIASSGNSYDLTAQGRILTRSASYHTWEFEPITTELLHGERVSAFRKKAATYPVTLVIYGSQTRRRAVITALEDDFERDIRELTPGRIIYGNWEAAAYIIESDTRPAENDPSKTIVSAGIYVPSGAWTRSEHRSFARPGGVEEAEFLDYKYDYMYDYTPIIYGSETWVTDAPFPSDFIMAIHGPCVNPRVEIGGHPYVVNTAVEEGETLVIDSKACTVMIGDENHFDDRNKAQSVFEKLTAGTLAITWGDFAFDLTIIEERSSPKWS